MNKYPIVSIVTPSLNQGRFIEDTIKSVLSQEGNFCLDYIIVDGCSTDNSIEIIQKYSFLLSENKYPIKCQGIEYRWLSEPDKGQSEAINKGFRMATGEITAYLNSDDLYNPGAIANVVYYFLRNPKAGLVYGDSFDIDESNKKIRFNESRGKFKLKTLKRGDTVCQSAVFLKKEVIDKVGLLNETLHFVMDYEWFIRIAYKYRAQYIPLVLASTREHHKSKTYDQLSLELRAENLLTVIKYGGLKNFATVFGYTILRLVKNKGLIHKQSYEILKQAILKKIDITDIRLNEKTFLKGYAYFFLLDALIYASQNRKRALGDINLVLRWFPFLLLSRAGLIIFIKLILPQGIYSFLKNRIKYALNNYSVDKMTGLT